MTIPYRMRINLTLTRPLVLTFLQNKQYATGVVTFVIPSETNSEEFAIYDVEFDFGSLTLHGTQLERKPIKSGKP
jgi:hypothetical protein